MTLHLVLLSRKYILHVSDRLVSLSTGGMHDSVANKNLVYQARDAIVSIGYTGLAYGLSPNKDTPTDEWLAEILWGEPFLRGPDGKRPATSRIGPHRGKWLDLWQALDLIRSEFQKSMDRIPPKHKNPGFEVIITGWQIMHRRGYRPIQFTIEKPWGNKPFKLEPPPRHLFEGKDNWIAATPDGYITDKEGQDIVHKAASMSADEAEEFLADNIRRVASAHPRRVGSHCLSTLLVPPNELAPIRVRFSPSIPHKAVVTSQDNAIKQELPIAFSPWIITPNGYTSASIIVGNTEVNSGILNITIEAPKPDAGMIGYMGSLDRPPAP